MLFALLSAFAFPLQVYTNSTAPVLFPHIILVLILFLDFYSKGFRLPRLKYVKMSAIGILISIYTVSFLINSAWQTLLTFISLQEMLSIWINYIPPIFCYWYFAKYAADSEINAFATGMMIAGIAIGIDFAYDSYSKLTTGKVRDYAQKAYEYSQMRSGDDEVSNSRINAYYRSFGLLENHAVSAAWIAIGSFSTFFIGRKIKTLLKTVVVIFFAMLILISLNFTTILCYTIVFLILHTATLRSAGNFVRSMLAIIAIIGVVVFLAFLITGPLFFEIMSENITNQLALLFNVGDLRVNHSDIIARYPFKEYIMQYPISIFVGDGFSSFGLGKGGDIGFFETMARLGLPFFVVVIVSCGITTWAIIKQVIYDGRLLTSVLLTKKESVRFAGSLFLFIFLCDIHYSIWVAKSIQPVLFFGLAMIDKNLIKIKYA